MKNLQSDHLTTQEQLDILFEVKSKLTGSALDKIVNSLKKNPDIEFFSDSTVQDYETRKMYIYAPIVGVPVERSFWSYKYFLDSNRASMTEDSITGSQNNYLYATTKK